MKDYYKILGIPRTATNEEIKKAWKLASLKWHPDRNSHPDAHARMVEINEAYDVLNNEDKRYFYDQKLNNSYTYTSSTSSTAPPRPNSTYTPPRQNPYTNYTPPREYERESGFNWKIVGHIIWVLVLIFRLVHSNSCNKSSTPDFKFNTQNFPPVVADTILFDHELDFNPDSLAQTLKVPEKIYPMDTVLKPPFLAFGKTEAGTVLDRAFTKTCNRFYKGRYNLDSVTTFFLIDYTKKTETGKLHLYYLNRDGKAFKKTQWDFYTDMKESISKTLIIQDFVNKVKNSKAR